MPILYFHYAAEMHKTRPGCAQCNTLLRCATPSIPGSAKIMIRCHLSILMGRDKLRISDVAQRTGLNRSTITALYNETATRVELPAIESLCNLFQCQIGELFEVVPTDAEGQS